MTEGGREADARNIDAARGEKSGAALEQVEHGIERELGVARERAQLRRRLVGVALDREEALDQRARLLRQRGVRAERGLLEEAIGDLADRAAADGGDAGDRQQIGDERVRGLRVGAGERGQHALVFGARRAGLEREQIEIALEPSGAAEILDEPALPGRSEIEIVDQRREQPDVAHPDVGRGRRRIAAAASRPSESISASAAAVSVRPNDSTPACRNSLGPSSRWRNTGPR